MQHTVTPAVIFHSSHISAMLAEPQQRNSLAFYCCCMKRGEALVICVNVESAAAICQGLHGGYVTACSSEPQGTTFTGGHPQPVFEK
jgi:hypothetical protein